MKTCNVTVLNPSGIHARPASVFVKLATSFRSDITVTVNGSDYNGKSILRLMAAQIFKGTTITLTAEGPDEDEAIEALAKAVETGLGEAV